MVPLLQMLAIVQFTDCLDENGACERAFPTVFGPDQAFSLNMAPAAQVGSDEQNYLDFAKLGLHVTYNINCLEYSLAYSFLIWIVFPDYM